MKQYKKMQDFHKPCILFSLPLFLKNKEKEVYD